MVNNELLGITFADTHSSPDVRRQVHDAVVVQRVPSVNGRFPVLRDEKGKLGVVDGVVLSVETDEDSAVQ